MDWNLAELQVQRALVSDTKTSWWSVTTGAAQGQIRPNSSIYDLDNRTEGTSARWQAIQNPEECLTCQMSDSEGLQTSGEMGCRVPRVHSLESSSAKNDLWIMVKNKMSMSQQWAFCTQEGQQHPGLHKEELYQQTKKLILVLYSGCLTGAHRQEPGSSHWCPMTGQEVRIRNHYRKFHLNVWKTFLLWQWSNTGTGCPEKFWNLCPWRYSKTHSRQSPAVLARRLRTDGFWMFLLKHHKHSFKPRLEKMML